jgi:hypothetical protein
MTFDYMACQNHDLYAHVHENHDKYDQRFPTFLFAFDFSKSILLSSTPFRMATFENVAATTSLAGNDNRSVDLNFSPGVQQASGSAPCSKKSLKTSYHYQRAFCRRASPYMWAGRHIRDPKPSARVRRLGRACLGLRLLRGVL